MSGTSSTQTTWSKSKTALKKGWHRKTRPEKTVKKEPSTDIESCLLLGSVYEYDNNLLAARSVYKQGLSSMPNDAQQIQLQKEILAVSASIRQRNEQLHLIPREIWELVLEHLDYQDLQQCACTFGVWSSICLDQPDFLNVWCTVSTPYERFSQLYCKSSTIQIGGPNTFFQSSDDRWLRNILLMLRWWSNNTYQTIVFTHVHIADSTASDIAQMLRSIHPPFKKVMLQPSTHITSSSAMLIMESCSRTEQVTFSSKILPVDVRPVIIHGIKILSITYLELGFRNIDDRQTNLVCAMVSQCSNLIHLNLLLGSRICHSDFAKHAIKCCPRLKILNVGCEPGTRSDEWAVKFGDDNAPKTSLQRILKYSSVGSKYSDFASIVDSSHKFLKSLYVYDYYSNASHTNLRALSGRPWPCLRKVHFRLYKVNSQQRILPPSSDVLQGLINFFSSNCCLEEIVLDFGEHCYSYHDPDPMAMNLLLTIARNCRLLRRLSIGGPIRYTGDAMLHFAAVAVSNITHMEICMYRQDAVAFITKLTTLTYFRFSDASYDANGSNDSAYYNAQSSRLFVDAIEHIIHQRKKLK